MVSKLINDKVVNLKDVYVEDIDMTVYVPERVESSVTNTDFSKDVAAYAEHDSMLLMNLFGGDQQC